MATANSMSIGRFLATAVHLPKDISVLLRGPHGVGKSKVIRQLSRMIAKNEGRKPYPFIDQRLGQKTEGDIVGLPSTDGNVTRFNPPDWYKKACDEPCVIFLDEMNRATIEVMQAAFQIVLDRELNGHVLHPDTRVYSAINASAEYTVNEMDPALLDRFWTIDLTPTVSDWITWASDPNEGNINEVIVDFVRQHPKFLNPGKGAEPNSVEPTPRSWERLNNTLVASKMINQPEEQIFYSLCTGFIGVEATIAFTAFAATVNTRVSGEDVIENYKKHAKTIAKFTQDQRLALVESVNKYVHENVTCLDNKQGKNLQMYMDQLDAELRQSLWGKLMSEGTKNLDLMRSVHKWCKDSILKVFAPDAVKKKKNEKNDEPEEFAAS